MTQTTESLQQQLDHLTELYNSLVKDFNALAERCFGPSKVVPLEATAAQSVKQKQVDTPAWDDSEDINPDFWIITEPTSEGRRFYQCLIRGTPRLVKDRNKAKRFYNEKDAETILPKLGKEATLVPGYER